VCCGSERELFVVVASAATFTKSTQPVTWILSNMATVLTFLYLRSPYMGLNAFNKPVDHIVDIRTHTI